MSNARKGWLVLGGDLADALDDEQIGGLKASVTDDGSTTFTMLDCFDQSIGKSGGLLIETARLVLYRDGGSVVQDATRKGNFIADLPDGPVKDALGAVSPLRSLLKIGTGTIRRSRLVLIDDEGKTQARAELVLLRSGGDAVPITIASLQGLRGYDDALDALRDRLASAEVQGTNSLADLTELLFPEHVPYLAKPEIEIPEDATAIRAANAIVAAYLDVARRNEAGIVADHDTEFLHDYRVALRKIRSVVSLFKGVYSDAQTAALKEEFSTLMAPTGRLRDLDVYLLERGHYYEMLPETLHDGLTLMFRIFARERRQELKRLGKHLQSRAYDTSITELEALFVGGAAPASGPEAERPALEYACRLIWKRYRKVCKIAATISDDTADETVHELRINCKKLRYLMEFFAPVFPSRDFKALLKPLKELQDNLGLFNDYAVQQVALREFMDSHASKQQKQDLQLAQSIGALIAVLHGRQKAERKRVMSSFAHFDSPVIRAQFRDLFHRKGA